MNDPVIVCTFSKEQLYKEILQDLNLIQTKDKIEQELINQAKDAIENALAIDLLAKHMLKVM